MTRILLLSCLLFAACKKKDEAKPAEPAAVEKKADDKSGSAAATAPDPAKPAEPTPPAAGAVTIANAADYDAKATAMTDKLLAVFVAGGKDCDKLAAELTKFGDENRATFEGLKAFEKTNPDVEKAFDAKMKPREKEFEEKVGPAFEACKTHEGMRTAMQKMPL